MRARLTVAALAALLIALVVPAGAPAMSEPPKPHCMVDPPGGYPVRAFEPASKPLGTPRVVRRGRSLEASVRARRDGVVRLTVARDGRLLGTCTATAVAGSELACRIRLARGEHRRGLRLKATLRVDGELIAVRRSSARRSP